MLRETLTALRACIVTFALCAVAYPAAVYLLGHTLFPSQAEGSLIVRDGKVIGSSLIAQPFASDRSFSPRPSAAGANGYAADAASGSNLATTNPALRDRIAVDAARWISRKSGDPDLKSRLETFDKLREKLASADASVQEGLAPKIDVARSELVARATTLGENPDLLVPIDLVTASGAGLDPDISPEAARYQAPLVAKARQLPLDVVLQKIEARIDRSGAIFGAPERVNVLLLNLDLDQTIAR